MTKKTLSVALLILSVALFVACSKGVRALPLIGLSYSYNGFSIKDVRLVNASTDEELKNKKIRIGETLHISIERLKGFKVENDSINPACKITVTDKDGNVAVFSEDVYAGQRFPRDTETFYAQITMGKPIEAGQSYTTVVNLYDKLNPEYVIDITVKSDVTQ